MLYKGRKVKFLLFFLLAFLVLSFNKAYALNNGTFGEKTEINTSKEWSIKFNKAIQNTKDNLSKIKVLDQKGTEKAINVEINADGKSLKVKPLKKYDGGKYYSLVVNKDVKSSSGKVLGKDITMKFKTANSPVAPKEDDKYTICIDPGQLWDDYVVGKSGTKASDINLAIGLKTGEALKKKGINVVYTRDSKNVNWNKNDDLQRRKSVIEQNKADLVLSLHCNVYPQDSKVKGIETFYLENRSYDKNLAQIIQGNLIKYTGAINREIKVHTSDKNNILSVTSAPAALVELGFISNAEEEELLKGEVYQQKCADSMAEAMYKFLKDNPKEETDSSKLTISVKDMLVNLNIGDKYSLPNKTKATVNGVEKEFSVKWDVNSFNTSKAGTFNYKGTLENTDKTFNLRIVISQKSKSKYKVCLDAGHGDFDTGAVGVTGVLEKDINLAVALKVGNYLSKNGIDVVYTRTTDKINFPREQAANLQARCNIANNAKVDAFVSIHSNSFEREGAYGIETYLYRSGTKESRNLANLIQNELAKETSALNRGVKEAGYYVLHNVNAPSVLTELGFVSNSKEEKLLSSDAYRTKCAKAIARAILKNFGINNPVLN